MFLGLRERKKSLEEIFNEIWPMARNNNLQIKILDQNALEFLASGKGFILDRLRLDILTKIFRRIFN